MILVLPSLGAALCLFLIAVLAAKRPFRGADAALLAWFAAQALAFTSISISAAMPAFVPLVWLSLGQLCLFSLGPIQLVYARIVTGRTPGLRLQGGVVLAVAALLFCLPLTVDLQAQSGAIVAVNPPVWLFIIPPVALTVSAAWPLVALRIAGQARRGAKDRYSNLGGVDPGWIRTWAISALAVIGISQLIFLNTFVAFLPLDWHVAALIAFQILQVVYVAHRGLTRPGIFQATRQQIESMRIDTAAAQADFSAATARLAATKLFLEPELTAARLANELGWAPERLTLAFRVGGHTNFHDAVLRARLTEMESLARDPANARVTTLALGLDAGFGSKSAMYDAFRRELSTTPAAWRRAVGQS